MLSQFSTGWYSPLNLKLYPSSYLHMIFQKIPSGLSTYLRFRMYHGPSNIRTPSLET